ncbi:UNVERIFIED_CONTAM: hypothetical protein K2H54_038503 [Gekko kuhli]
MGASISKEVIGEELQKLMGDLENKNLQDVIDENSNDLNLLENTTLDIAITGMSGAGKSSLVNALRGMPDYGEGAAETGEKQITMKQQEYPHPTFPKVILWDLPGIGTPQFEPKEYLEQVNFEKYDFFIIVASNRFTTNDALLACEIQKMGKKFYYVRTKVDVSIDSERRKPNFIQEKCLEEIRTYCRENLTQERESVPMVFLISRWDLQMYDFPFLQETLENDLKGLKRAVLIAAMPAFSKEVLEKKRATMDTFIWKVALASCAIGSASIPGLSLVCDIGILVGTMRYFCKVFGLDEDCLHRLANRVGKSVDVLQSAIKKSPMASQVTAEFLFGGTGGCAGLGGGHVGLGSGSHTGSGGWLSATAATSLHLPLTPLKAEWWRVALGWTVVALGWPVAVAAAAVEALAWVAAAALGQLMAAALGQRVVAEGLGLLAKGMLDWVAAAVVLGRLAEAEGLWQEVEEGLHRMLLAFLREDPSADNFFTQLDGARHSCTPHTDSTFLSEEAKGGLQVLLQELLREDLSAGRLAGLLDVSMWEKKMVENVGLFGGREAEASLAGRNGCISISRTTQTNFIRL